jgi:hypothetical protein
MGATPGHWCINFPVRVEEQLDKSFLLPTMEIWFLPLVDVPLRRVPMLA